MIHGQTLAGDSRSTATIQQPHKNTQSYKSARYHSWFCLGCNGVFVHIWKWSLVATLLNILPWWGEKEGKNTTSSYKTLSKPIFPSNTCDLIQHSTRFPVTKPVILLPVCWPCNLYWLIQTKVYQSIITSLRCTYLTCVTDSLQAYLLNNHLI